MVMIDSAPSSSAAWKPLARLAPYPRFSPCRTRRTSGRAAAIPAVPSVDPSSTTITHPSKYLRTASITAPTVAASS
jgi:hypothetical protein